ncbi:hypothetical protein HDU86_007844 [Geranomyces michiganensis]|nr:hypothetical protein HDU86_007844 [Geranomyces michiganensis]
MRGVGDDSPLRASSKVASPQRALRMRRREESLASPGRSLGLDNADCYPSPSAGAISPTSEPRVLRPRIPRQTPMAAREPISDSDSSGRDDDDFDAVPITPTRLVGDIASENRHIWSQAVAAAREKKTLSQRAVSSAKSQPARENDDNDIPRLPPAIRCSAIATDWHSDGVLPPSPMPANRRDSIVEVTCDELPDLRVGRGRGRKRAARKDTPRKELDLLAPGLPMKV